MKYISIITIAIVTVMILIFINIKGNRNTMDKNPLDNGRWIVSIEEGSLEGRTVDDLIVREYNDILRIIHKMSNTMIIPVDGVIDGKIDITKTNLEVFYQSIYKYYMDTYGTEDSFYKSDAYKIVSMWLEEDFTYCVDIHNYTTLLLGIQKGEAIELDYRDEY